MAALGIDAAVFQDQNAVRFTHGGHPLGDYHQGSAGEIPPQRLPQRGGCGVVQGAVGIVQYQDLRPVRQGPGDQQPLALAAGEVGAAQVQRGVQTLRQLGDKGPRLGRFRRKEIFS